MLTTRLSRTIQVVALPTLCIGAVARSAHAQRNAACAVPATANSVGTSHVVDLRTGAHDVVVNGVRLWYCVAGHRLAGVPPVLFLHGGPGYNSYSFAALAGPRLERGLRMIYLDQRGSGHSERPWTRHYQLDTLVADVDAFRAALGVPKLAVIGHSFGGTLALEYAAAHPDRVSRMVVVSGAADMPAACHARVTWIAAHYPTELARARARAATDTSPAARADCALAFSALTGDSLMSYNNAVMFPDSSLRIRQDSVDAASGLRNTGELSRAQLGGSLLTYRFVRADRLTMPVLVLAGRFDSAIGMEQQRALASRIPRPRLVEFEHGGHFLYLDEPDRFAHEVITFLTGPGSH